MPSNCSSQHGNPSRYQNTYEVTTLKLNPIIDSNPNDLLSSGSFSQVLKYDYGGCKDDTMFISQILQTNIFIRCTREYFQVVVFLHCVGCPVEEYYRPSLTCPRRSLFMGTMARSSSMMETLSKSLSLSCTGAFGRDNKIIWIALNIS